MKLGELIKSYRGKTKLTMQEFASKAGLSKGYISMLEKNQHPQSQRPLTPSLDTYQKVASAMSLTLDELIAVLDGDETVRLAQPVSEYDLTETEAKILSLCKSLNYDGQLKVYDYASDLIDSGKYEISISTFIKDNTIQYNAIAAHERTDIEVTDEMRAADDAIMEDDDF